MSTGSYQAAARHFRGAFNTRSVPLSAADIFERLATSVRRPEALRGPVGQGIDSLGTENPDAFFGHLLTLALRSPAKRALIDVRRQSSRPRAAKEFIDGVVVPNARASLATLGPSRAPGRHVLRLLRLYEASTEARGHGDLERGRSDERSLTHQSRERLYGTAVAARLVPVPAVDHRQVRRRRGRRGPSPARCSDDISHPGGPDVRRPPSVFSRRCCSTAMVADGGFPARLPRSRKSQGCPPLRSRRCEAVVLVFGTGVWEAWFTVTIVAHRHRLRLGHRVTRTKRRRSALIVGTSPPRQGGSSNAALELRQTYLTRSIHGLLGHPPHSDGVDLSLVQLRAEGRRRQTFRRAAPPSAPGRRRRNRHHLPGDTFVVATPQPRQRLRDHLGQKT